MRREIFILVAILLLGGALVATSEAMEENARVIGARHPLPAGTRITLGDVMAIDRPKALEPKKAVRLEKAATVIGSTLVHDVEAGMPITTDDVGQAPSQGTTVTRPRLAQRPTSSVRGGRGVGRLTMRGLLRRAGRIESRRRGLKRS